jgi:CBS domain-containing protein
MTENLVTVNADDSVMEAARLMSEKGISSLVVSHEKEFQGMITDRDILGRVVSKGLDPSRVRVGDVKSSPLVTIDEQTTIEEAAKKMRENNVRRLVVERNYRKVGMIAESDIVRVDPELHYLIRERSKLQATLTPSEPREVVLAGCCEECGNYSPRLRNINGRWLDEECRTP